jgi:catechol 2,3-dioxygenase
MAVTTDDIFGDAAGAQPAAPGTYGEAAKHGRLPSDTRLGPVHLRIADLDRSLRFYEGTLGLRLLHRDGVHAVLAPHDTEAPLVELHARKGAQPAPSRGRLGLYHFAILMPDRASLGRFVRHLGEIHTRAGSADHLVSEALYLHDPDNLGIEVYADRPRSAWQRIGRELMMAVDPLDMPALLREAGDTPWAGMPAGTVMGHVHLHVADIDAASSFFSDALGFDRMVWSYPGALFLAAGGYHHHLGTNIWAGAGAMPPSPEDAQLLEWTIELPTAEAIDAVSHSLARAGAPTEVAGPGQPRSVLTRDPWGTPVRLRIAAE